MSGSISRGELLAFSPGPLLDSVFPAGSGSDDWGTATLALCEQVREAGNPIEALELCLVGLHNVREVAQRAGIMAPAREHLSAVVDMQARGAPRLSEWMEGIRDRVVTAGDLAIAIDLLGRARSTWISIEAMPRSDAGSGSA